MFANEYCSFNDAIDAYLNTPLKDEKSIESSLQSLQKLVSQNQNGETSDSLKLNQLLFDDQSGLCAQLKRHNVTHKSAIIIITFIDQLLLKKLINFKSDLERINLISAILERLQVDNYPDELGKVVFAFLHEHCLQLGFQSLEVAINCLINCFKNFINKSLVQVSDMVADSSLFLVQRLYNLSIEPRKHYHMSNAYDIILCKLIVRCFAYCVFHPQSEVRSRVFTLIGSNEDHLISLANSSDNNLIRTIEDVVQNNVVPQLVDLLKTLGPDGKSDHSYSLNVFKLCVRLLGNEVSRSRNMNCLAEYVKSISSITRESYVFEELYAAWFIMMQKCSEKGGHNLTQDRISFLFNLYQPVPRESAVCTIRLQHIWYLLTIILPHSMPITEFNYYFTIFACNLIGETNYNSMISPMERKSTQSRIVKVSPENASNNGVLFKLLGHLIVQVLSKLPPSSLESVNWERFRIPEKKDLQVNLWNNISSIYPSVLACFNLWLNQNFHSDHPDRKANFVVNIWRALISNFSTKFSQENKDFARLLVQYSHLLTDLCDFQLVELLTITKILGMKKCYDTILFEPNIKESSIYKLTVTLLQKGMSTLNPSKSESQIDNVQEIASRDCSLPSYKDLVLSWSTQIRDLLTFLGSHLKNKYSPESKKSCEEFLKLYSHLLELITPPENDISSDLAGAILSIWQLLALQLSDVSELYHRIADGDLLKPDLSTFFTYLEWPLKYSPKSLRKSDKRFLCETLHRIYSVFVDEATLLTTVESNSWCDRLCRWIYHSLTENRQNWVKLVNVEVILHLLYLLITKYRMEDSECDTESRFSSSHSDWSHKRSHPLGHLTTVFDLLLIIVDYLPEDQSNAVYDVNDSIWLSVLNQSKLIASLSNRRSQSNTSQGFESDVLCWCESMKLLMSQLYCADDKIVGLLERIALPYSQLMNRLAKETNNKTKSAEELLVFFLNRLQNSFSGPYDSPRLEKLSPLIEHSLTARQSTVCQTAVTFWNATFGRAESLTLPPKLQSLLVPHKSSTNHRQRKSLNHLIIPKLNNDDNSDLSDSCQENVEPVVVSQMSQESVDETVKDIPKTPVSPRGSFLKHLQERNTSPSAGMSKNGTAICGWEENLSVTPSGLSDIMKKCKSEPRGRGRPSLKRRLFHEDSNSTQDYVVISPTNNSDIKRRKTLTDHQKEVMAEQKRHYVPAIMDDNTQSSLILLQNTESQSQTRPDLCESNSNTTSGQLPDSSCIVFHKPQIPGPTHLPESTNDESGSDLNQNPSPSNMEVADARETNNENPSQQEPEVPEEVVPTVPTGAVQDSSPTPVVDEKTSDELVPDTQRETSPPSSGRAGDLDEDVFMIPDTEEIEDPAKLTVSRGDTVTPCNNPETSLLVSTSENEQPLDQGSNSNREMTTGHMEEKVLNSDPPQPSPTPLNESDPGPQITPPGEGVVVNGDGEFPRFPIPPPPPPPATPVGGVPTHGDQMGGKRSADHIVSNSSLLNALLKQSTKLSDAPMAGGGNAKPWPLTSTKSVDRCSNSIMSSRAQRMVALGRQQAEARLKQRANRSFPTASPGATVGVDLDSSFNDSENDITASSPKPSHLSNRSICGSPGVGIIRDFFTPKKGHRVSFAEPLVELRNLSGGALDSAVSIEEDNTPLEILRETLVKQKDECKEVPDTVADEGGETRQNQDDCNVSDVSNEDLTLSEIKRQIKATQSPRMESIAETRDSGDSSQTSQSIQTLPEEQADSLSRKSPPTSANSSRNSPSLSARPMVTHTQESPSFLKSPSSRRKDKNPVKKSLNKKELRKRNFSSQSSSKKRKITLDFSSCGGDKELSQMKTSDHPIEIEEDSDKLEELPPPKESQVKDDEDEIVLIPDTEPNDFDTSSEISKQTHPITIPVNEEVQTLSPEAPLTDEDKISNRDFVNSPVEKDSSKTEELNDEEESVATSSPFSTAEDEKKADEDVTEEDGAPPFGATDGAGPVGDQMEKEEKKSIIISESQSSEPPVESVTRESSPPPPMTDQIQPATDSMKKSESAVRSVPTGAASSALMDSSLSPNKAPCLYFWEPSEPAVDDNETQMMESETSTAQIEDEREESCVLCEELITSDSLLLSHHMVENLTDDVTLRNHLHNLREKGFATIGQLSRNTFSNLSESYPELGRKEFKEIQSVLCYYATHCNQGRDDLHAKIEDLRSELNGLGWNARQEYRADIMALLQDLIFYRHD